MCKHPTCLNGICRRPETVKKKKPVKKVSDKRAAVNQVYSKQSKEIREARHWCEIKSPVCTGKTEGIHHKKGRGKYLLSTETFIASCNACNAWVEANPEEAKSLGVAEKRNYQIQRPKF